MAADQAAEVRAMLRRVGARRDRHRTEAENLQNATKDAVAAALDVIPLKEVAKLLRLNRSTVYEQYLQGGEGGSSERGATKAGVAAGKSDQNGTRAAKA